MTQMTSHNMDIYIYTVFSPLLCLYTSDCCSSNESCSIVKFAHDTVLIVLISDDYRSKYDDEMNNFLRPIAKEF